MTNVSEPARETKRADQLAVGDWLHHRPIPQVVQAVVPLDSGRVCVLSADRPGGEPFLDRHSADAELELATAAEIAEAEAAIARRAFIHRLDSLTAWFVDNPWAPVPYSVRLQAEICESRYDAEILATAAELAKHAGTEPRIDDASVTVRTEPVPGIELVFYSTRPHPPADGEYAPEGRTTAVAEPKPDTYGQALGHHGPTS